MMECAVISMAAGLLIGLGEVLCRTILRHSRYRVWHPNALRVLQIHPSVHPSFRDSITFMTNAEGERGRTCPRDCFRILVAGGSATECYYLDQADTWAAVLERRLNDARALRLLAARYVHVGNIARSSVDSTSLLYILQAVLPQDYYLDAIVVMVGANDVLRWLEIGAPTDIVPPRLTADACFDEHPEKRFRWTPSECAMSESWWRMRGRVVCPSRVRICGEWMPMARRARAACGSVAGMTGDPAAMLARFGRCLQGCIEVASQRARVVVVRPVWFRRKSYSLREQRMFWSGAVGNAQYGDAEKYFSVDVLNALLTAVDDRAVVVANQLGVPCVEVQSRLDASLEDFYDYFHLTRTGAAKVGAAVEEALLDYARLGSGVVGRAEDARTPPTAGVSSPRWSRADRRQADSARRGSADHVRKGAHSAADYEAQ